MKILVIILAFALFGCTKEAVSEKSELIIYDDGTSREDILKHSGCLYSLDTSGVFIIRKREDW